MLAEIFQDLLTNRDDYLRALRALLREIVRSMRQDVNFTDFAQGLLSSISEAKLKELEKTDSTLKVGDLLRTHDAGRTYDAGRTFIT